MYHYLQQQQQPKNQKKNKSKKIPDYLHVYSENYGVTQTTLLSFCCYIKMSQQQQQRPPPLNITTTTSNTAPLRDEWSPSEIQIFERLRNAGDEDESLVAKSLRIASSLPKKNARLVAKRIVEEELQKEGR
jgi:hypothetical protein